MNKMSKGHHHILWWWICVVQLCGRVPRTIALAAASSSKTTNIIEFSSYLPPFRHVVVAGGGPVGLAAALILSNPPHSYNVTVLEQTPDDGSDSSITAFNPTRAYLYLITPRGLEFLDHFPYALQRLQELGTSSSTARDLVEIPGRPDIPIDFAKNRGTRLANLTQDAKKPVRSNIWVPRHQMIQLLLETCHKQNSKKQPQRANVTDGTATDDEVVLGSIQVCYDKRVTQILDTSPTHGTGAMQLICADGSTYDASLLVAADGIDSKVRQVLAATNRTHQNDKSDSWLTRNAKQFQVKKYKSPSAGIKLKCLQFPPNFTLRNTDGRILETTSTRMYVIRSTNTGTERLGLGMLPVKDPTLVRPANVNTRDNHKLWSIHSGPEMKAYFQKSFPRIHWDEIITNDAEWERFAKAQGTTFPMPQYSPGTVVTSPHAPEHVGVVLVGDACHAFPPDIGQGINSGLNDVVALDRCLQGKDIITGDEIATKKGRSNNHKPTLSEALETYQKNRRPEHRALIRLARFGAPYQYRQSAWRDRVGSALWFANTVSRLVLNKLTGGVFPTVAIASVFQTLDPNRKPPYYTYRQIMRKADLATNLLWGSVLLTVAWWMVRRLGLLAVPV